MTNETISIVIDEEAPPGPVALMVKQATFWACIVAAEGISHAWFGGSFVIDLVAIVLIIFFAKGLAEKSAGHKAVMRPAELKAWVDDGMPIGVRDWLTAQRSGNMKVILPRKSK